MVKSKKKTDKPKSKGKIAGDRNSISQWFENNYRLLFLSVLALSVALRISLLLELPRMPFNQLQKAPDLDMNFFDLWGDRIAGGDIWTDTIWHPYHYWHNEVAKSIGIQNKEEGKQKWGEWYGGKKYHQEPLYPLIIGLSKMIFGKSLLYVYILQMLVGLLSIWMIMWLGKHYFGAMAGIMGGLLFALYGPNLLFDAVLLRTSFSTALVLGMLYFAEKLNTGKSQPWMMGLLGGAGYLLWTISMLLWIPLVIRWLYLRRQDLKKSWQIVAGFSILLSFLIIRNNIAGTSPFSTSSVGPITYILANFPGYEPELGFAFFPQAGQIMEKTGGHMIPAAIQIIEAHDSIWDWIVLQFKKLGAVFHWYEIPNNINTYLATKMSMTLKLTFIPYSFIAALGLMGMVLSLKKRKLINLFFGILTQVAIMVIFYVLCRFRVPMVAMLAIFAGFTLQQLTEFKKIKLLLLTSIGSIFFLLFVLRPQPKISVNFVKGDLTTYFLLYYLPKLDELSASGRMADCAPLFEEFVATIPKHIAKVIAVDELKTEKERELAGYYGKLYFDLAKLYKDLGNPNKANENFQKSEKLGMKEN